MVHESRYNKLEKTDFSAALEANSGKHGGV
jgi:hypothetical protein